MLETKIPISVYSRDEQVGAGTYGSVFIVQTNLGTSAEKSFIMAEDEYIDPSFFVELSIYRQLQHENIITLRGIDAPNAALYFDLCQGDVNSLAKMVTRQACIDMLPEIIQQISSALTYLNEQGIYHNDIKPANILFRARENSGIQFFLTDFGLAGKVGNIQPLDLGGTFPSPESQLITNAVVYEETFPTLALDKWAFGVTLLFLITRYNFISETKSLKYLLTHRSQGESKLTVPQFTLGIIRAEINTSLDIAKMVKEVSGSLEGVSTEIREYIQNCLHYNPFTRCSLPTSFIPSLKEDGVKEDSIASRLLAAGYNSKVASLSSCLYQQKCADKVEDITSTIFQIAYLVERCTEQYEGGDKKAFLFSPLSLYSTYKEFVYTPSRIFFDQVEEVYAKLDYDLLNITSPILMNNYIDTPFLFNTTIPFRIKKEWYYRTIQEGMGDQTVILTLFLAEPYLSLDMEKNNILRLICQHFSSIINCGYKPMSREKLLLHLSVLLDIPPEEVFNREDFKQIYNQVRQSSFERMLINEIGFSTLLFQLLFLTDVIEGKESITSSYLVDLTSWLTEDNEDSDNKKEEIYKVIRMKIEEEELIESPFFHCNYNQLQLLKSIITK